MQIAGTWIWAVYPNSQTYPKKQQAASEGLKFSVVISSRAEEFEQRTGYVIIIASMYKNAYKTVLSAGLPCVIQCSPRETGTVILSISLMRKLRLRRKGSVTWGNCWDFGSLTAECFILRMNVSFLSRNLLEGIQGSGA